MVFVSTSRLWQRVDWKHVPDIATIKSAPLSLKAAPNTPNNSTTLPTAPPPTSTAPPPPAALPRPIPSATFVANTFPPPSLYQRGVAQFLSTTEKIELLLQLLLKKIEAFFVQHVPSIVHKIKDLTTGAAHKVTFFVTTYPVVSGILITVTITLCIVWVVKKKRLIAHQKQQITEKAELIQGLYKEFQTFMNDNPELQVHEMLMKNTTYSGVFDSAKTASQGNRDKMWEFFLKEIQLYDFTSKIISPVRNPRKGGKLDRRARSRSPLHGYQ
ncbi:hypothetical protein K0U07_00180 [bacterium]|nr:hypothetical protein [bacterium]